MSIHYSVELEDYLKPYMSQADFDFIVYMNNLQEQYSIAVGLSNDGKIQKPKDLVDPQNIERLKKLTNLRDSVMIAVFKEIFNELITES